MMNPLRGEIWLLDLNPTRGSEMGKRRPVLVVNRDALARLPLRIIVPITTWKPHLGRLPWFVRVEPTEENGLQRVSGIDAFQLRAVDVGRFIRKLGHLTPSEMARVDQALRLVLNL